MDPIQFVTLAEAKAHRRRQGGWVFANMDKIDEDTFTDFYAWFPAEFDPSDIFSHLFAGDRKGMVI